MEAVWISLPRSSDPGIRSCFSIRRTAAWRTKKTARRFTSITRSHSTSVTSSIGCTRMTPALLNSTSRRPPALVGLVHHARDVVRLHDVGPHRHLAQLPRELLDSG